jgi:hypothetical protein
VTRDQLEMGLRDALKDATAFSKLLEGIGACQDGKKWAKGKTLTQAWACSQGAFMYWFVQKLAQRRQELDLINETQRFKINAVSMAIYLTADASFPRGTRVERVRKDRLARGIRACFSPLGVLKV